MRDSAQRSWQLIMAVCQTESHTDRPVSCRMAIRASISAGIKEESKREYDGTLPSRADIKEE